MKSKRAFKKAARKQRKSSKHEKSYFVLEFERFSKLANRTTK